MTDYAGLVEYIVRNMVDHPDAVVVEAQPGRGRSQTIEISLDPEDVGRVIGKGGRNIEAIRAVVKAASIKDHERVNVEVLADDLPVAGEAAQVVEGPAEEFAAAQAEPTMTAESRAAEAPGPAEAPGANEGPEPGAEHEPGAEPEPSAEPEPGADSRVTETAD